MLNLMIYKAFMKYMDNFISAPKEIFMYMISMLINL